MNNGIIYLYWISLILYRPWHFINHLLTYLLAYLQQNLLTASGGLIVHVTQSWCFWWPICRRLVDVCCILSAFHRGC